MKTLMEKLEHFLELGGIEKGHRRYWSFPALLSCCSLLEVAAFSL